jgi:hypothetical protein
MTTSTLSIALEVRDLRDFLIRSVKPDSPQVDPGLKKEIRLRLSGMKPGPRLSRSSADACYLFPGGSMHKARDPPGGIQNQGLARVPERAVIISMLEIAQGAS